MIQVSWDHAFDLCFINWQKSCLAGQVCSRCCVLWMRGSTLVVTNLHCLKCCLSKGGKRMKLHKQGTWKIEDLETKAQPSCLCLPVNPAATEMTEEWLHLQTSSSKQLCMEAGFILSCFKVMRALNRRLNPVCCCLQWSFDSFHTLTLLFVGRCYYTCDCCCYWCSCLCCLLPTCWGSQECAIGLASLSNSPRPQPVGC